MAKYNLIGNRYGHLVVEKELPPNRHKEVVWLCRCDCGDTHIATSYNLMRGRTTTCRSCMFARIAKSQTKHRCEPKRLHEIYTNMKTRCHNPNYVLWHRYGGRGISICKEWEESFTAFREWALNSGYSENLTLDRIDNDGDYCPQNCKWSTITEQSNNRRNNRYITSSGKTDTMANWARKTGIPYYVLQKRLYDGWSDEEIVTIPYVRGQRYDLARRYAQQGREA